MANANLAFVMQRRRLTLHIPMAATLLWRGELRSFFVLGIIFNHLGIATRVVRAEAIKKAMLRKACVSPNFETCKNRMVWLCRAGSACLI